MRDMIVMTFKKYYLVFILFMVGTTMMMRTIHNDYYGQMVGISSIKMMLTFIYGGIIALVIIHLIDRLAGLKKKNLLYLVIPVMMLIVYFNVLGDLGGFSNSLKYFLLCLLTGLTLFVIPFIGKGGDSEHYSYQALISLALTMLCYLLLIIGVFFTMMSVSTLFEIAIKEYIYVEVGIFMLGFMMPILFLSLILNNDKKEDRYPKFINRVAQYIVYPILSIYTLVLYMYFIKILVEFKWPANTLGNLIIYYSLVSIMVLYFTSKMHDLSKWSEKFNIIYPYALIIPNVMMLTTLIIRIKEYGFTEARYYGILCFVFVMISIYIIKKIKKVKYIPITLSILLLISVFGPLSSFNISKISQRDRIEHILISNKMLKDDVLVRNVDISEKDQQTIIGILIYFDNVHSLKDLDFLPNDFDFNQMEAIFGFPNGRK